MIDLKRLRALVDRCRSLTPASIPKKVAAKIQGFLSENQARRKDLSHQTYTDLGPTGNLNTYLAPMPPDYLQPQARTLGVIGSKYIEHEFDLLGSGWTNVRYGMACPGVEGVRYAPGDKVVADGKGRWLKGRINAANEAFSRSVWASVDSDYTPIDWQLDFKSGFRWDASTWYKHIRYGERIGADVKVPWELSRMQHLPQLALAYRLSTAGQRDFLAPGCYLKAFVNQVLDFIAANPPRFGVNWNCTMDVSIRAINWLVAYDLFKAHGADFENSFKDYFKNSLYDHAKHIAGNPEFSLELRGNHYLANITGLLYLAAYLPSSAQTDAWLSFAVKALMIECRTQFNADGSNFEASTSYHRLSTEMLIYALALIKRIHSDCPVAATGGRRLSIDLTPLIDIAEKRVDKAIQFSIDMTGPAYQSIQIGDNDNGRLLKLQPVWETIGASEIQTIFHNLNATDKGKNGGSYLLENFLDHRHLLAAAAGLLPQSDWGSGVENGFYENFLTRNLSKSPAKNSSDVILSPDRPSNDTPETIGRFSKPIHRFAYPDFGVYGFRSDNLYVAIRCGPIGQNGFGGHAHNDQLSIVLALNNHFLLVDPGSYAYTPLPEKRNAFRSGQMHNTLASRCLEQNDFVNETLFALKEKTYSRLRVFDDDRFSGEHYGYGKPHRRDVFLLKKGIRCTDTCFKEGVYLCFHLDHDVEVECAANGQEALLRRDKKTYQFIARTGSISVLDSFYSAAYGWIRKSKALRVSGFPGTVEWRLSEVP